MRVTYALRVPTSPAGISQRLDGHLRTIPLAALERTAKRALSTPREGGLIRTTASVSLEASQRLTQVCAKTGVPAQRLLRQILREY